MSQILDSLPADSIDYTTLKGSFSVQAFKVLNKIGKELNVISGK